MNGVTDLAETARKTAGGKQPISSHPLFPIIVALWSGALLGLISVAIRPSVIEHIVLALGIDRVVPMTAPPLGTTMRVVMTLSATLFGAALGGLLARRLAGPRPAPYQSRMRAEPDEQSPITGFGVSAPEEAQDSAPTPEVAAPRRRRLPSFARDAHDTDRDPVTESEEPQILDMAELALEDDFDAEPSFSPLADASLAPGSESPAPSRLFDSYASAVRGNEAGDVKPSAPESMSAIAAPGFQLLPVEDEDEDRQDENASPLIATKAEEFSLSAAERIASAPLDELSPVELLERLAQTIARRRATAAAAAAAEAEIAAKRASEVAAEPKTTGTDQGPIAEPMAEPIPEPVQTFAPFAAPSPFSAPAPAPAAQPMPAALRPLSFIDDADEDEEELPGYLPPRHISMATRPLHHVTPMSRAVADEEDEDEHEDVLEEGYSSLLNLSRPATPRQPFPSLGELEELQAPFEPAASLPRFSRPASLKPVASTPAIHAEVQAESETDPTERALRAALATLQRMSGAA
jgi:hypothetical protein